MIARNPAKTITYFITAVHAIQGKNPVLKMDMQNVQNRYAKEIYALD